MDNVYRSCVSCKHELLDEDKIPCVECCGKTGYPKWEAAKLCSTCEHEDLDGGELPCSQCKLLEGSDEETSDNWTPKKHRLEKIADAIHEGAKEAGVKFASSVNHFDKVNSPSHYNTGKIEVIDYIEDQLTPEEYKGYLEGNVIKYVSRYKHKNGAEDLRKAEWYLKRLIGVLENG